MGRQVVIPQRDAAPDDGKRDVTYWSKQLVIPSRRRQVSRFWLEKAVLLTDSVQIFALMWQLSQPWPWPARWLLATRWTNAFNLDLFSFRATGAAMGASSQSFSLWGEMHNYWLYALAWALVPWTGVLALQAARRHWTRQGTSDFLLQSLAWENVLLQALQFLYVPVGLAVLRLVNCNADGSVSVDPTGMGACRGARHVMAVVLVTGLLGGGFLLGLPWLLRRRIRESLSQSSVDSHERFLRGKELEFILGTSESYLELYMPQYASFLRHSVEMPVQVCLMKLFLLCTFSVLRSPAPSKTNQGAQGSLFFLAVVSVAVWQTWRRPFRCVSSSYMAMLVDWMLVANGVFVLLCANGVRSALTVSTSVTSSLAFLNVLFLAVIGVICLRYLVQWHFYPHSVDTKSLYWPTNEHMRDIVEHGPAVSTWVNAIKDAQDIILSSLLVAPSMRCYDELHTTLEQIESYNEEATAGDHLLMDQLYELSMYINELYVEAIASSPFRQSAFPAQELSGLNGVLQRRKERHLLRSSRSQRVLKRLHIVKSWARPSQLSREDTKLEAFLAAEASRWSAAAVADWRVMNLILRLIVPGRKNSYTELLICVTGWSAGQDLVKWQALRDPSRGAEDRGQESVFSLIEARQTGIHGALISCGDSEQSAAILQALNGPVSPSEE